MSAKMRSQVLWGLQDRWWLVLLGAAAVLICMAWSRSAVSVDQLPPGQTSGQAAIGLSSAAGSKDSRGGETGSTWHFVFPWALALIGSIAGLVFAWHFFQTMMKAPEGNERMREIAGYVRTAANAYLWQQYKVVAGFFVIIFILLAIAAFGLEVQSRWVPFAFLTGGFFSGLAGWFGMKTATWASSRTAEAARNSLNQGLQVAFRSGAVMGLTVVGLGLLDICMWFAILYWVIGWFGYSMTLEQITVTMLCFGMGASSQALFARVGGGIYTKAADVGADLVGKVEAGIPEDDPRNPAVIADNVGDNVGDVAGMGADLYESYCGSILATAALGVAAFATGELVPQGMSVLEAQLRALFLPMVIAGIGIVLSIAGVYLVRSEESATQKVLLKALARGINFSTFGILIATFIFTWWLMPQYWTVALSVVAGLLAGWLIGKWTEYSTSDEFKPTRELAEQALTGPATVIIGGVAEGMKSTWFPVIVVCVAMLAAFGFAAQGKFTDVQWFAMGLYGVGIAAVGMLSTLGITLATDAYGPIADNAGGNAEMSHLGPEVRQRTDALDSLGNTTAATGKGFAIGSAALTALALLAAYVEEVRVGFERWAESALTSAEPGFYKLSDRFIGRKLKEPEPETKRLTTGYLVFPDELADEEIAKQWAKLDTTKGPVKVDELVEEDTAKNGGQRGQVRFKATKAPLVEVRWATMPDFARYYEVHLMNPKVLVGVLIGAMAVFLFCSLTLKAVGRTAKQMVEEVRRQFRERPGIMQGTEQPDYAAPVTISTRAAQREMIFPSVLGLVTPVLVGWILGVGGVMGLLIGALSTGFCVAVFMANAGGSWDNAKKHIERGAHGGKGSAPHKAAVVGDTVGDPFKDTSGPSLNILIKLMSMVSVVAAGLVVRYSLAALGWF
ncbi:MAG: sodium-translocating pyrophosphatase [Thermoguttaceae bacterium]|nr:sodium-translocating pyrophosphatase [Thermoguttaceae bacterium]MDW8038321.1 sodium-translocating pyrophosphatase [Thermoguttaceae bacterium]